MGSDDVWVYLSGPMSDYPEFNFPAFNAKAEELRARDEFDIVINPADRGVIEGWGWADYLRVDIRDLSTCNAIYMLPGWQNSRGARLEHHIALELGMDIYEEVPGK